jgi:hypothetical protein
MGDMNFDPSRLARSDDSKMLSYGMPAGEAYDSDEQLPISRASWAVESNV